MLDAAQQQGSELAPVSHEGKLRWLNFLRGSPALSDAQRKNALAQERLMETIHPLYADDLAKPNLKPWKRVIMENGSMKIRAALELPAIAQGI